MSRWNHTYFKAALADTQIDTDKGIIRDVVMCQVGEARGHYVSLEQEFIDDLVKLAKKVKPGSKARYGHPTMCSEALGTMLGRFKNVRVRDHQAIGDLHLSEFSAKSPEGDLKTYVLERADEDPDSFGASIVFTPGESYQRDPETGDKVFRNKKNKDGSIKRDEDGYAIRDPRWNYDSTTYASIKEYHGTDLVDQGAATDGLFSDPKLFASRISRFLDENPDIDQFLDSNPDVEDKAIQFLARRRESKQDNRMNASETTKKLNILERSFEDLKKAFSTKPSVEDPTEEAEEVDFETLKTQLSEAQATAKSFKEQFEDEARLRQQLSSDLKKFESQLKELQEENQKLGEKEEGEDAPGADAKTPPPSSSSDDADPFAEEHQFASKRHEARKSLQTHKN